MRQPITAVDLFAGAGGESEGMEQAGLNVVVANEINLHAAMTYKFNHLDTVVFQKDIRKLSVNSLLEIEKNVDIIFAGLPCQGFSNAGRKEKSDRRNYLFKEVMRLTKGIKPRVVLIENVTGLLAPRNHLFIANIEKCLSQMGYNVSMKVFDASEFGVPQKRRRLLILGSQNPEIKLSSFQHSKRGRISVGDAIGDLEFLEEGTSLEYPSLPKTIYQRKMRGKQDQLWNHATAKHCRRV